MARVLSRAERLEAFLGRLGRRTGELVRQRIAARLAEVEAELAARKGA